MKTKIFLTVSVMLLLVVGAFGFSRVIGSTIAAATSCCCCKGDSCPMKKDKDAKADCDCCKGDSCPMKKDKTAGPSASGDSKSCDCDCCKHDKAGPKA